MKVVIILGSSSSVGNTYQLAVQVAKQTDARIIDLADHPISYYDYQHENRNDGFLPLIKSLLEYEHIIFASPIYWYSMSAQMKVLFDRLSELLTIEKPLGRQLKGKTCSVIVTGVAKEMPECFDEPFKLTAQYMHIDYLATLYQYCPDNQNYIEVNKQELSDFVEQITLNYSNFCQ